MTTRWPGTMVAALCCVLVVAVFFTGCSTTPDIVLRNSAGQTAQCEGFDIASGWGRSQLLSKLQRECVEDYQRQGYERVPE
jgi:hypothetical protein